MNLSKMFDSYCYFIMFYRRNYLLFRQNLISANIHDISENSSNINGIITKLANVGHLFFFAIWPFGNSVIEPDELLNEHQVVGVAHIYS